MPEVLKPPRQKAAGVTNRTDQLATAV